ncbi:hypothetical protein DB347_04125 [Opitutaceae bacterium EW11]|nr:hypothetical protein DB347_04125 [Opitutaceae bacterium EW11]
MKTIRLLFILFASCAAPWWAAAEQPAPAQSETAAAEKAAPAETPPATAPEDETADEPKPAAAETPAPAPQASEQTKPTEPAAAPAQSTSPAPAPEREAGATPEAPAAPKPAPAPQHRRGSSRDVVSFGGAHLFPGETANDVVSILGNSLAEGEVGQDVVAVLGNSEAREDVGQGVVAVMGNAIARKNVGQDVVAVMGNAEIYGHVRGQVVAVMGMIKLGPDAQVDGGVVCVGSRIERAPGAEIHGQVTEVPFLSHVPGAGTVGTWFQETVLKARLLSWDPHILWPWGIAFAFLGVYVLLGLIFDKPLRACAETLEQRPGRTILASFLALILTPPLFIILSFTVLGGVALVLALFIGTLFGKAAFFGFLGRRITNPLGIKSTALSVLIGGLIAMVIYTIPLLGLVLWKIGSMVGLGMAVYTTILSMRREKAPPVPPVVLATASAGAAPAAVPPLPTTTASTPNVEGTVSNQSPGFGASAAVAPAPAETPRTFAPPPVPISSASLERVGFWRRLCASMLDLVLIGVMCGMLHVDGGFATLIFTVYHVVMWALKGTTIGGIILEIKVVRVDDRKLDWTVAIVRALAGFLSLALAGFGFIWVAFDEQRQSWHDKIAGTTIVRVPKGVSLV